MDIYLQKTKSFPIGVIGTSLGFMTLANVWDIHGVHFLKPLAIIFALVALGLMLLKTIFHFNQVKEELRHPVLGGFYPTIDMACFVLASYLLPYHPIIAKTIWILGVINHLALFFFFFTLRLKRFKVESVLPSWNVVLVGVCVACVTSTGMGFPGLANFLTYLGIILYVPFYPFLMYRVYFHGKKIDENSASTIGILAAPSSLVLTAYLTTTPHHNVPILCYLIFSSILNIILVYIEIPKFIKKGFNPSYAAFTFPLAISMLAMWRVADLIIRIDGHGHTLFRVISNIELILGSCMIAYVVVNFLIIFIKVLIKREKRFMLRHHH